MANQSGVLTNAQGALTVFASRGDSASFQTTGTYTVEYPLGTVAISAAATSRSLSIPDGGAFRVIALTGAVNWNVYDNSDAPAITLDQARRLINISAAPMRCKGVLIDGDSLGAQNWTELQVTGAITQAAGTASLTTTSLSSTPGGRVKVGNYGDSRWDGEFTVATLAGTTITFPIDANADVAPSFGTRSQGVINQPLQRTASGDYVWAEMVNGTNYSLIDNVAIGGRVLTEILSDAPFTIGRYTGCLIDFCGGTNDPKNGVSLAVSSAAMESYIQYAISCGHTVLINTVPPLYGAANTAGVQQATLSLNKEFKRLAIAYNQPLYDKYAALVDPATAALLAANADTSDNIHLTPTAARICGTAKASIYANFVPTRRINLPATTSDTIGTISTSQNIMAGFFTGTGGATSGSASGSIATGWTLGGTLAAVGSKGSGTVGSTQIITAPADGSASGKTTTLVGTSIHASLVAGGRYEFVGKLTLAGFTSPVRATLAMLMTLPAGGGEIRAVSTRNATSALPTGSVPMTFRSEPWTMPAGTTASVCTPSLTLVQTGATAGTETITCESWAFNRLD